MSTIAALGGISLTDDWQLASIVLLVSYLVFYPLYLIFVRVKHTRRIKNQLVTSMYKLPIDLSPAELAYVFSTRVSRQQLYATLLHLANRSIVILDKTADGTLARIGPKIEKNMKPYEIILLAQLHESETPVKVDKVLHGFTNYSGGKNEKIRGSRQYVFWWLLRQDLRTRKLIEKHMTSKYAKLLLKFGVFWSLVLAVLPVTLFRLLQMLDSGEVDFSGLGSTIRSTSLLWLMVLPLLLFMSFFLLRTRGWMLGREWLMTTSFKRYLQQLEAYREFVRLTHRNKLHFESKELEREARANTRPFAIAFGYVKE